MAYDVVIKGGRIYDGAGCLPLQEMWQVCPDVKTSFGRFGIHKKLHNNP